MENEIMLHGQLALAPRVSHANHGETFYIFPLRVRRLSGTEDRLNVVASERLLRLCAVDEGDEVTVQGQVRSFNDRTADKNRLVITAFARQMRRERGPDENHLRLAGVLCKPPSFRRTPLGRDICDMMLAVNRTYGRADYLPCISWGALAYRCAQLGVGDPVALEGRLQSRTYTKRLEDREELRTAFEVSVMTMDTQEGDLNCANGCEEELKADS